MSFSQVRCFAVTTFLHRAIDVVPVNNAIVNCFVFFDELLRSRSLFVSCRLLFYVILLLCYLGVNIKIRLKVAQLANKIERCMYNPRDF